jgi:hypothetical protein
VLIYFTFQRPGICAGSHHKKLAAFNYNEPSAILGLFHPPASLPASCPPILNIPFFCKKKQNQNATLAVPSYHLTRMKIEAQKVFFLLVFLTQKRVTWKRVRIGK